MERKRRESCFWNGAEKHWEFAYNHQIFNRFSFVFKIQIESKPWMLKRGKRGPEQKITVFRSRENVIAFPFNPPRYNNNISYKVHRDLQRTRITLQQKVHWLNNWALQLGKGLDESHHYDSYKNKNFEFSCQRYFWGSQ